MVRLSEAQIQNVSFLETGHTGETDFVAILFSVTNSCLPSSSRFRFQGNLVGVSRTLV
jgi:hypothetical protein